MSTELFDGNAHLTADEKALIKATQGNRRRCRSASPAGSGRWRRRSRRPQHALGPNAPDAGCAQRILWRSSRSCSPPEQVFLRSTRMRANRITLISRCTTPFWGRTSRWSKPFSAAGADLNAITTDGNTPLNLAVRRGNLSLMKLLIERGAALTKFSRQKFYPPLCVVSHSDIPWEIKPAMVEMLLNARRRSQRSRRAEYYGAPIVDRRSRRGKPPPH